MPMSFSCRWDWLDVGEDCVTLFLQGCRESALRASRAMVGAPLPAAAGRAAAVKLQTNREFQSLDVAHDFRISSSR
jgi:hypothetical protein